MTATRTAVDPVRPEIRAIKAYAVSTELPAPLRVKLDFNESPYDVPAPIKERVLARLERRTWSLYPEIGSPRLKEAIARSIGRPPEEIVVGNGSGEVILAAVSVLAGSGGALVLAPPTFSLYRQMASIAGARLLEVPRLGSDFALDEEGLLACLAREERAVPLVCTPNNPTGGTLPPGTLARLAAASPALLVDQAYVDFAPAEDDALPLLKNHYNIIIFRTLSKAYSVAGFRIGYAVAHPDLARELEKGFLPYSVDAGAEELAVAVLEDSETARRTVATIASERDRLADGLRALGSRVASSRANFLFFTPPLGDGPEVRARLLARGVLIRDMNAAVPGYLRVTVGTAEQNDLFLEALGEALEPRGER